MDKKEQCYLNVTLKDEDNEKNDVIVSISGIFRKFKKYFLVWLVTAVVSVMLILTGSAIFSSDQHKAMSALVSFTFDGIEKGLDPDGNKFDVNSLKNPFVIESALTKLGYPLDELEIIRQSISIEEIIPSDAIDRIITYKSVYENATNGALSAAQAMLDVTYYPTQYKVKFNYSQTSFENDEAVEIFNTILECYRDYFFETYGYNKALGSAVTVLDYTKYDYAESVDVFDSTLSTLKSYVSHLAEEDTTRFRSANTGYTFSDLSEAIKTIQEMDLDRISSYVTVNNVTKDKDTLIDYYQYRIDALNREKAIASETLATISNLIETYQKDTIMVFGNGTDNTDTQETQYSEQYDSLIRQKISAQNTVSTATQRVNYYNQRIKSLKEKPVGSDAKVEKVEEYFNDLNIKVNELIDNINKTADEYYTTVAFANAYNVLVPASASSVVHSVKNVVEDSVNIIFIVEALIAVIYICVSFLTAVIEESKKKAVPVKSEEKTEEKTEAK
ncbi:MAG: lipopolysaccharide biosynthesis protein [Ruminococcus sp.]|nr:lipopolysaccharide biosynthesis protein [Oscillospiraceae bacterium]MDY4413118.1 lipopolysaccharide biosynthesis protein [Ruminococcus sp.]